MSKCRRWRWAGVAGTLCLLTTLAAGCSPERRYKVLSFFFDGVPDPNAPAKSATPKRPGRKQPVERSPIVSRHKPVVDDQCRACHKGQVGADPMFAFSAVNPGICMDCHENTPRQHKVMHGPVAAKACLWCHAAHESTVAHLLREPTPAICLQCHDAQSLGSKVPQHQDPKSDCLSCHFGHGGDARFLLKPTSTTQPALTLSALPPQHDSTAKPQPSPTTTPEERP